MSEENVHTYTVTDEEVGTRLDIFLTWKLPDITRSRLKGIISDGHVSVADRVAGKAGRVLKGGERVVIAVPAPPPPELAYNPIDLDILYEDDDLIVVNKGHGIAVHPGAGRPDGTLVNALIGRPGGLSSVGAPIRPGVVHRLDMDTTGVMVVAKTDICHDKLAAQFKNHTPRRRYVAIVWGRFKTKTGRIDAPLGRDVADRKKISTRSRKTRKAVTVFKVLKSFGGFSLVELSPETGRTHQIRVHLTSINHPVVGDQVYGTRKPPEGFGKPVLDSLKRIKRQLLHAATLGFTHPVTGEFVEFTAPMPPDMAELIRRLEASANR
jgi:23S rRNA pseudouridine1911/1915/1917 synthase